MTVLRVILSAMPAYLRASMQGMFQYRGELILWAIWGVVYPTVAMVAWQAAARDPIEGNTIKGYGAQEFATYFLLTMVIGHLCTAWDMFEIGYLIQSGKMSTKLLRPILPIWESISDNLAYKVLTLVILLPLWLLIALWARPRFDVSGMQALLGVMAIGLGAALNYIFNYALAMLAFWITRTDGLGQLWFGMSLFFGGRLAPVTIMPSPMQPLISMMPFKWIIWFPSAALMGQLSEREILIGLGCQLAWLAAGLLLFRILWRAGVKRFTAVGI
ncbi:MAG TPA: ABC-2 family transporter protein [Phycisphaerae bacterium]|nr:ABC-2 family transporter protein [Phycisphaerae bacterium]HRY67521.1 ABC-2 family transporter protein [Phycisphaerae bacterium]